ncbi:ribonuclease III domain-containing protein [Suillus paluster]|uniref:ribonuclease III domain-containing protein n=1 Tax=Suillus paluster TaxID=48578 RepID=UPI001B87CF9F|nr:ribonuclease III domain-containing protein [Suillus paluster]KAG1752427.1 ribonuclease III domain-containing protein [Suillus paluster]
MSIKYVCFSSYWLNILSRVPNVRMLLSDSPPCILRPTFDEGNPIPPLPDITTESILTQVFTHRSYFGRPNHVFEDHHLDPSPDNEKYEHLGDTVLGLVVTNLLLEMYPNLRVGPSTKIRALVVGNSTLADISRMYELPSRLRLHAAQAITLRASVNIQADVFESYVGGLYLEQDLAGVEPWLKALFGPYVTEAYKRVREQHRLPPLEPAALVAPDTVLASPPPSPPQHRSSVNPTTIGHLALFNQQLQKANRVVEWIYADGTGEGTKTTPIWIVTCEVDGEVYGHGQGGTKKAARNEAAKEGLKKMGIEV